MSRTTDTPEKDRFEHNKTSSPSCVPLSVNADNLTVSSKEILEGLEAELLGALPVDRPRLYWQDEQDSTAPKIRD